MWFFSANWTNLVFLKKLEKIEKKSKNWKKNIKIKNL